MRNVSVLMLFRHRNLVLAAGAFLARSLAVLFVASLARHDIEDRDATRFRMRVSHAERILQDAVERYAGLRSPEAPMVRLAGPRIDEHLPGQVEFLLESGYYPGLTGVALYESHEGLPDGKRRQWAYGSLSAPWPAGAEGEAWSKAALSHASGSENVRTYLPHSAQCRASQPCALLLFRPIRATPAAPDASSAPPVRAWLLANVAIDSLVQSLIPGQPGETQPRIRLNIFSSRSRSRSFVYSNVPATVALPKPRFRRSRHLRFGGSDLEFEFTSTPSFDATTDLSTLNAIAWGGAFGTLSISALVFVLASRRQEALRLAEQMRQASLRSEADARNLIEIANRSRDLFVVLDGGGRIRWLNGTAMRLSRMSRDELIGGDCSDEQTAPAPIRGAWLRALSAMRRGEAYRFQWRDDSFADAPAYWDIEFQSILAPGRQVESVLVFGRELSAEELSRQMLTRVQRAVESLNDAVYITGPNREALYSNRAFGLLLARLGLSGHDGLCLRDHLADKERAGSMERDFEASGVWSGELTYPTPGGESLHLIVSAHRIEDERRQNLGTVATFRDISARKEMEEDLRQARDAALLASRHKSSFLANMSHEIRTPMNGVLGMLRLLRETPLGSEQREYAELAARSAETLLTLLNDILDFSKIEAGQLRIERIGCSPADVFNEVCSLLRVTAIAKGLVFESNVGPSIPASILTDPTRLRQILHNLVGNAIKFTEYGSVRAFCGRRQDDLYFEIADTGIGVDPAKAGVLFEPFTQADGSTTRRFGGTGLGLAICKELAERLGGQIGVNRRESGGSLFWFTIPLSAASSHAESSPAEASVT